MRREMNVIVKVTDACNFACNYCSVGETAINQAINIATVKKMVDDLPELLNRVEDNKISILWHGGEPLLMPIEFYREAMSYAKEHLREYNLSFKMQSNGYLVDEKWIDLLREYKVNIGISLDGYQELHDANRCTKNEEPTFSVVMQNIARLRQADINPGILMVLNTSSSIDADKLFSFIRDNDFSCKIHAVYPCGRAELRQDVALVYHSYISLMKDLFLKMMECDTDVYIDPLSDILEAIIAGRRMGECSYAGSCGRDFLCLFEDGGVSFCGRNSNDFGLSYGNIQKNSLCELYYSVNAETIRLRQTHLIEKICAGCEDYELCHGGCSFEAALASGNIDSRYPHCEQWKELISFVRTGGLQLLRERLLRKRQQYKEQVEIKTMLLEVLAESEI